MATVNDASEVPRSSRPLPSPVSRRPLRKVRIGRLVACVLAAVVLTGAISALSAYYTPFVQPPRVTNVNGLRVVSSMSFAGTTPTQQRINDWTGEMESVEVATWGDHLKPWHIRMSTPFATRLTWFEKGRVYNRGDVKAPAGASSAAVSSWSFATSCWSAVGNKLTGPLPAPPELTQPNEQGRSWATAIEERGWPFRAFTCRIVAPMGESGAPVYVVEGGVWADGRSASPTGAIQDLRVIPTTPMWGGLLGDVAVFTAALYLLSFVPGWVYRRVRTKRGHCPRCRYDLRNTGGEAAGCPECGWNRQGVPQSQNPPPLPSTEASTVSGAEDRPPI